MGQIEPGLDRMEADGLSLFIMGHKFIALDFNQHNEAPPREALFYAEHINNRVVR